MFREVPVLPVVVPLAAVVLLVMLWLLRRRGLLTVPRAMVAVALCVYAAGVVANTVFPVYLDKPHEAVWQLYLDPFAPYDVADAVMNVAVFVPVGVLVPLVLPRAPWWVTAAVAAGFSLVIELVQYLTGNLLGGGHVADVHDLFFNVVGGLAGLALLTAVVRVPALDRLVDRFRWR